MTISLQATLYHVPLLLSALTLTALTFAILRRSASPVASAFAWMNTLGAAWVVVYALDIATADLSTKIILTALRLPIISSLTIAGLVLALHYSGRGAWVSGRRVALLLIPATIGFLLALTSQHHTLWRYDYRVIDDASIPLLVYRNGWAYGAYSVWSYTLVVVIVGIIVRAVRDASALYAWRAVLMLTGVAISLVPHALFEVGITPVRGYNIAPSLFGVSGLLFAWGTLRYRVLEVVPIARSFVVEQLRDAVLVLDAYDRVVDANQAAQHSLGLPAGGLIGRSADEVLPHWGLAIDRIGPEDMVHEQVRTGEGHLRRVLDVSMSPLVRGRGRPLGRLVVVRDVSESELAREAMRAAAALEAQQEAEERTRKEIAELLHGRVQTQLLVLKFKLGDLEKRWTDIPPEAQVLVHEIAEELERIREHDVRAASHRLFPSLLDLALTPAVFALAETYGPQLPVLVEVDPSLVEIDSPLQSRLPMAVRETSYRVIEEALGNVRRHAQATQAKVALALEGHQLVIRVEDDGRGCDPTTLAPGLGIRTIAARVTKLGGTWRFTGAPGAGSTMMVTLPLAPAERAFAGDLLVHLRDSFSSEAGVALPGVVAGK